MKVADQLAEAGSVIDAALLSVIFTSGTPEVHLSPRPRIAVLVSGDELSGAATATTMRDSNGPALSALVLSEGAQVVSVTHVADDAAATYAAVERLSGLCDLLVTSGGVSVGAHDHVGAALESRFELIAWRAAIQPGKPLLLGERRTGEPGARFALGVPGNPVSAFVIGVEVLLPLIRALAGRPAFGLESEGVLEEPVQSPIGRRSFLRLTALRTPGGDLARDAAGRTGESSNRVARHVRCARGHSRGGRQPRGRCGHSLASAFARHPTSGAAKRLGSAYGRAAPQSCWR
jgi:molybdopterin molybdotransferase